MPLCLPEQLQFKNIIIVTTNMNTKVNPDNQYVCTICGFNMIGDYPEYSPVCGAPNTVFLTSEECSNKYSVKAQ